MNKGQLNRITLRSESINKIVEMASQGNVSQSELVQEILDHHFQSVQGQKNKIITKYENDYAEMEMFYENLILKLDLECRNETLLASWDPRRKSFYEEAQLKYDYAFSLYEKIKQLNNTTWKMIKAIMPLEWYDKRYNLQNLNKAN